MTLIEINWNLTDDDSNEAYSNYIAWEMASSTYERIEYWHESEQASWVISLETLDIIKSELQAVEDKPQYTTRVIDQDEIEKAFERILESRKIKV